MVFKTLTSFPKGQKCQLCLTAKVDPEALGNICQTADVIVHYFCLLLASKIQQKGTDKQGLLGFFSRDIKKEIKRGSTIVCNYCKKNGATVMCSRENCHLNFHVPCAQQKGSLHQFFNQFKSFCEKHKPNQKIPASLKKRRDLECVLCCSHIKFNVRSHEDDPIWPTCCKPQALLHKRCLQHFATSSGYYFKCPFCSNKEEFHKGMKTFGIFIPEQEASWETEPNAFRELLERDVSCDAVRCRCPRGRVYSVRNSKWYLEVCILCGASGRHRGCMSESIMTETYECDVCAEVNKKFPNSLPSEDIPESSPLSDKGECNETVQQSVEENISKNLSLECEEIVIISDSESESNEVEVIDEIPPPTVTKNVRKRQLPVLPEKRPGLKRQRLAEGGAETSSGMCLTVNEESGSLLSQATDNPSFRTDELENNPQKCDINVRNRESINKLKDPGLEDPSLILMIEKVCTLSACDQTEIDQLNTDCFSTNEVDPIQNPIQYVDLVSDNETDQVFVISDTDSESIASSLLDSDSSLLDLSEIPESEKSLLLENVSPTINYAKEFPRRNQVHKKRRKKKKQVTQKKIKTSAKTNQNLEPKFDETVCNEQINISSNQGNLKFSSSSGIADINIPSSSLLVSRSSEEESFRGFCNEGTQSNNESVGISTPVTVEESTEANKTCINNEKVVNSAQHMPGNDIFLSSVDDTSECFTLNNLDLINKVKNIKDQVPDLGENAHPKYTDNNSVKTTSNPVVLKLLAKDDTNYNKPISNNLKLSKFKNNNHSNATVTSLQEECSKKSSIGAVICDSDPLELSRNIKNTNEDEIGSSKLEVTATPRQPGSDETNISNNLIEELFSRKKSKKTLKTNSKPAIEKSNKSGQTKRAYKKNNNKLKILCSLALKQPFGEISNSLSNLNKVQNNKNKSSKNISSETDPLPEVDTDVKVNFRSEISSKEVGLGIFDIPVGHFFNVSYNSIDKSLSPEKSGSGLQLHSPKTCTKVILKPDSSIHCSESHGESGSSIYSADLPMGSQSSLVVSESENTSRHQAGLEKSIRGVSSDSHSLNNLSVESPADTSQIQIGTPSSMIASEIPLKSNSSENISEITSIAPSSCTSYKVDLELSKSVGSSTKLDSSESMHEADLESQLSTKYSEPHQNSLLIKHTDVNTSQTPIESMNYKSNLDIEMVSKSSLQSEMESSKCVCEFPKISHSSPDFSKPHFVLDLSKINSNLSNLLEDEDNLKVQNINGENNLHSFQSHVNSPDEELQSCKLDSIETTKEGVKSELTEQSENRQICVSEFSNSLEDKLNLKEQKIDIENKSSVNFSVENLQCFKLESANSLEVSKNSSESSHNIKNNKPPRIKGSKKKSKDLCKSRKKSAFPIKSSNTNNSEDLVEDIKHLKQKKQTKPKPEVKIDLLASKECISQVHSVLPSSESNISQEQSVSETPEFFADSIVHMKSNICVKPEDATDLNSSLKVSNFSPPLDEEFNECFKNLVQANKRGKVETFFMTNIEKKFPIEIQIDLKDIDDSVTFDQEACIKNQDYKTITHEMDEDNVFESRNFEKQMSVEDSTVHSCTETKKICSDAQISPPLDIELSECSENSLSANTHSNFKTILTHTEENKLLDKIDSDLKVIEDSLSIMNKGCCLSNEDDKKLRHDTDENSVNTASKDSDGIKHDWYKICITDCSTCNNTITLRAKHNIMMNDSIDICFYCKAKINKTSLDGLSCQALSPCSCQDNTNNFTVEQHHEDSNSKVFNDSELSVNCSSIASDFNSNYKSNKQSPEKQKSPSKDCLIMDCKEISTLQAKSLNTSNLSPEKKNIASQPEKNLMESIPDLIEKSMDASEITESDTQLISEKIDSKIPKIKSVANMNDNESAKTPIKSTIRQIDDIRSPLLRLHYDEVFKVKVISKEPSRSSSNNNVSSLISHVETFLVHSRKRFRELLKSRYFSENDKNLTVYTDVCGFRYVRLFNENIPEKIDPMVIFETGGDISYYLEKLIKCHETESVTSPRIVLIVYGNTLIPDENVFNLLQSASNIKNIKLIVTTVLSQKPSILKFNKKLIYYSKRYGYYIWDITKIHFLTSTER